MWRGQLTFEPAMLFAIGFLVTFLFGGLTGVILASPPLDFAVSDSYFVVAHFHYVLFGTVVFSTFAGFYFWWPKWTGKMLDHTLGKFHFWTVFIGFNLTFLVQHWLGLMGMPRRVANYPFLPHLATTLNDISSIGAFILGASTFIFFYNVYKTWKHGERVTADDPWGFANSLEWATSCPPPRHNFTSIPRIRSERPAFDLHYPTHQNGPGPGHERVTVGAGPATVPSRGGQMKVEGYLFLGCAVFFGGSDFVYWYFSHDPTGSTALAIAVGLAFLIGFYVLFTGRRLPPRPEDEPEGEIYQGTGELGFFSPHSWWPLFLALAAATAAIGVAIGWWLFLIGMLMVAARHHRLRVRVLPRPLRPLTGTGPADRHRSQPRSASGPGLTAGPPGAIADESGEAGGEEHRHDERRQGDAAGDGEADLLQNRVPGQDQRRERARQDQPGRRDRRARRA